MYKELKLNIEITDLEEEKQNEYIDAMWEQELEVQREMSRGGL